MTETIWTLQQVFRTLSDYPQEEDQTKQINEVIILYID